MFPRIRTIKPEFFRHEQLFELEKETGLPLRVAFIGLWTCADREGRFQWRPRALKTLILPYDDVDFSRVLDALTTRGYLVRYASQGDEFAYIPTFKRHQVINNRESASGLPKPPQLPPNQDVDASATRASRVHHASHKERKGKETTTNPLPPYDLAGADTAKDPPAPPVNGGDPNVVYVERYGEIIEVQMGRHKRLPNLEQFVGARIQIIAKHLTAKGFPSKLVKER